MGLHRPRTRLLYLAAATAVPVLYALWIRPQMLDLGRDSRRGHRYVPGDELVPIPTAGRRWPRSFRRRQRACGPGWCRWEATPPRRLVQLGLADNNGRPSANRIVPEWQSLKQGQHLARVSPPGNKGPSWFTVEVLEPNRTQVLHQLTACFRGLSFDPDSRPAPWAYVGGGWGFYLWATRSGGTRLVARSRSRGAPRPVARPLHPLLGEPLHFLTQTRQVHNLASVSMRSRETDTGFRRPPCPTSATSTPARGEGVRVCP